MLNFIKSNPAIKNLALFLLSPRNQARPRAWIKLLVNPFIHKKGKGSVVRRNTRMDVFPYKNFTMGKNSTIEDFAVINNGVGDVYIGDNTRIGIANVLIGPITVGSNVMLAQNIVCSGLNHGYKDINTPPSLQPVSTAQINIEDDVWIGANSVITAGVTIGKHSVIGAGSVVTKSVPEYSVVVGNPAKVIRKYDFTVNDWVKV